MTQEQTLRKLRKMAKAKGLSFDVAYSKGKGSHAKVYCGDRQTTVPSKVPTGTYNAILKQLNLKD